MDEVWGAEDEMSTIWDLLYALYLDVCVYV